MPKGWRYQTLMKSLTLVLLIGLFVTSDAIDCRRFVFAPMCRGVAAKRAAGSNPPASRDIPSLEDLFGMFMESQGQVPLTESDASSSSARTWTDDQGPKLESFYKWYVNRKHNAEATYDE